MPRAPYSQGPCANCGAHRLLKYAHRTMCCRYKCQKAAAAQRQARLGGADDAVVPTFCFKIEAVLGMRFCDPEQLIAKKRRNKLAAADKAICYLTRGKFRVDRHGHDAWAEHEPQVAAEQRTAEASSGGAASNNAAVAEFEEGLEQAA